jgi:hypothetical protein
MLIAARLEVIELRLQRNRAFPQTLDDGVKTCDGLFQAADSSFEFQDFDLAGGDAVISSRSNALDR